MELDRSENTVELTVPLRRGPVHLMVQQKVQQRVWHWRGDRVRTWNLGEKGIEMITGKIISEMIRPCVYVHRAKVALVVRFHED